MTITNLHELWCEELRDLYSAEEQIIAALPKMISKTSNSSLNDALRQHLEVTKEQYERLVALARDYNFTITGHSCKGMAGIIAEATQLLEQIDDTNTRDAAIIASAQRVEHYEIAGYGTALAFAKELNFDQAVDLLEETLSEEVEADELLTQVAEGGIFSAGVNEKAKEDVSMPM